MTDTGRSGLRTADGGAGPPPRRVLLPKETLCDPKALRAAFSAQVAGVSDAKTRRALASACLMEVKQDANRRLAAAFRDAPAQAEALVHSQADLTDHLVTLAWDMTCSALEPQAAAQLQEPLALLAVGGYGRAEMAPHSDVDLLFLTARKITPAAEPLVETLLYLLWDLKLKVGHSTRSLKECLTLAREDITIRTALLEHRFLTGDAALQRELDALMWSDLFKSTGREFIGAKLAERAERHRRQGGQRYVLEPNVKEGKGGLRDLQTLYWIGKYLHRVQDPSGLVGAGLFNADE